MDNNYNEILADYGQHQRINRGMADKTVKAYLSDLRNFFRYLECADVEAGEEIPVEGVTIEDLRSVTLEDLNIYIRESSRYRNNSAATLRRKCSALKSLYKYLANNLGMDFPNVAASLELPKAKQAHIDYLTINEAVKLLETTYCIRDKAILTLFIHCGLRLQEMVDLDVTSIRKSPSGYNLTVRGKGDKERVLPLDTACQSILKQWAQVRPKVPTMALFCTGQGRLNPRTIQEMFRRTAVNAGIYREGLTVHKLRHTAATMLHQYGGVDIRTLQEILGHNSIKSTQIYTHVCANEIEQAMAKHPMA